MSSVEVVATPAGPARLRRSRRRTLAISVLPGGALELAAPEDASLEAILARVGKRLAWIARQRRFFEDLASSRPALRYVTGATHRYLGRQYRLKISEGGRPAVVLRGGHLQVTTSRTGEQGIRNALEAWYRRQARQQFDRRLAAWEAWCRHHRIAPPRLCLRSMAKRWGSATRNGVIYLNPELIRAPSACIDYVIIHEVCHLRHPHHGKAFYAELSRLCPDWRARKQRLESLER